VRNVEWSYSGRVREAFRARGHDAWSCDLLPAEVWSPFHYQGELRHCLADMISWGGWDLVIAHPPCTYLTNSGERWMKDNPERQEKRRLAVEFVQWIMDLPYPRIAVENPVGHLSSAIRKPDQIIQPYHFGHLERKTTCLWLKNLPPLKRTDDKTAEAMALPPAERDRVHWMPPSKDRWKERSRTYTGIAEAMAEQWGALELEVA
jgi:site-specific DNA-cytosine methylase